MNKEGIETENKKPFQMIVLLTTCINTINHPEKGKEGKERLDLYLQQIMKWITKTQLPIVVVENSNTDFLTSSTELAELVASLPKERFVRFYTFQPDEWYGSATAGEEKSIRYAMKQLQQEDEFVSSETLPYILKVTGRYYLENVESKFASLVETGEKSMYLQIHRHDGGQNSEYFAIQWNRMQSFLDSIENQLMEEALSLFQS